MTKVIAAVYGSDTKRKDVSPFQRKLSELLKEMGMKPLAVLDSLDIEQIKEEYRDHPMRTLAIGWASKKVPNWTEPFDAGLQEISYRQLLLLDLYERTRADGRPMTHPRFNAGTYLGRKLKRNALSRFLSGDVVQISTLYGLRWIEHEHGNEGQKRTGFIIEPGDQEEIAIVRFIFDQFVNQEVSRTQISNLLNAQGVTPPGKCRVWGHNNVGTILTNEPYAGASRYKDYVRYDLFAPIIDMSMFLMAQARLHQRRHVRLSTKARMMRGADGS